jgi:hypothetical protein
MCPSMDAATGRKPPARAGVSAHNLVISVYYLALLRLMFQTCVSKGPKKKN